ncbi:MAG: NusG domain II-containing protein [Bacteroidota bacterium]
MKMITLGDKILIVVLFLCTAGSFFAKNLLASQGSLVIIELKEMPVYKGKLTEDRKVTIKGAYGDVRVQIRGGNVAVVHADCPNKVCVRTGWRSHSGESIICVPNQVVVRILGEERNEVRGITG